MMRFAMTSAMAGTTVRACCLPVSRSWCTRPAGWRAKSGIGMVFAGGWVVTGTGPGLLAVEAFFYRDLMHGTGREWHASGRLAVENVHEYGVLVHQREWDEAGVLLLDRATATSEAFEAHLDMMRRQYGPAPWAAGENEPELRRRWRDRAALAAAQPWPGPTVGPAEISRGKDGLWYHHGQPLTGSVEEPTDGNRCAGRYEYRLGLLWGTSRSWRPGGTPATDAHYQQGVRHGWCSAWYPSGRLEGTARHEYGILVEQQEWTEAGTLIEDYRIDADDPDNLLLSGLRQLPIL